MVLVGCIGPKARSFILHYGEIPYAMEYSCVKKALEKLPNIISISYKNTQQKYQDQQQEHHTYTYRAADDYYPKVLDVLIRDNSRTSVSHSSGTEEFYWGENETKKLNEEKPLMQIVEKVVAERCHLPAEFFKERFKANK